MALLDLARRAKLELVVCHVNYQKRDSAWRDEEIVRAYCDRYGLPLYVSYAKELKGNFQAAARLFRYEFFLKIAFLTNTFEILMAHHKDDFLETLLMQAKRRDYTTFYGIKRHSFYKELKIWRPLLDLEKADLERYCQKKAITYGEDETNRKDHYTRNFIRHHLLKDLPRFKKEVLYRKVLAIDESLTKKEKLYQEKYGSKNTYKLKELEQVDDLRLFLDLKLEKHLSEAEFKELKRQLFHAGKMQYHYQDRTLFKEGEAISFQKRSEYHFCLTRPKAINTPYFKTSLKMEEGFSEIHLEKEDFPLTIRNYQKGDRIKIKEGTKKVSRIYIDHKVKKSKRLLAPVVLNSHNEIIMVPPFSVKDGYLAKASNFYVKNLLMKR